MTISVELYRARIGIHNMRSLQVRCNFVLHPVMLFLLQLLRLLIVLQNKTYKNIFFLQMFDFSINITCKILSCYWLMVLIFSCFVIGTFVFLYFKVPGVYITYIKNYSNVIIYEFVHNVIENLIIYVIFSCIVNILYISGDIEKNPGPRSESTCKSPDSTLSDPSIELFLEKYFTITHLNVQSILPKLDFIRSELCFYDILLFSESWLTPDIDDSDIMIDGFHKPLRFDRSNKKGGGIIAYISNSVYFKPRPEFIVNGLECIWFETCLKGKRLLIGTFYRPPDSDLSIWQKIEHSIDIAFNSKPDYLIITGDFNEDQLNPNNKKIKRILENFNLSQLIEDPTHYWDNSFSLLDLFIINSQDIVISSGVGETFYDVNVRYHCPIFLALHIDKPKKLSFKRTIWEYKNGNYDLFREKLQNTNWALIMDNDLDTIALKITETIKSAALISIPSKEVTVRSRDKPWMHNKLRSLIRKRKRFHKRAKKSNSPIHWAQFRKLRNKCNNLVRQARENYFNKLKAQLNSGNIDDKNWWQVSKSFLFMNKPLTIPPLLVNDSVITDDQAKAEVFNDYFVNQTYLNDTDKRLPTINESNNLIENIHITPKDIEDILLSLNTSKASGPDYIHPLLLKKSADILCYPLCNYFNLLLENSKFPSSWKLANVTPVHKKDDASNICNYRPISLLSILGKVFERCVYKYLNNYLIEYNLITDFQSGFRQGDSAVNQLLHISNDIGKALDQGKEIRAVFCDISKAFDRVWHQGLLHKLKSIGVGGKLLLWFKSYLENRTQKVVLNNGISSSVKELKAGVPQGSILGPLLFTIFINDIVFSIQSNIRLFADDTSLYIIVDNPTDASDTINSDLQKIAEWANTWLVSFNPNKTESMIISRKTSIPFHPMLYMNNIPIIEVDNHKHLGIYFSSDGSWNFHINTIKSKAICRLNLLRKLKFQLDRRSLEKMYFTFIRPLLEYADIVWDNMTEDLKDQIENINLDAARIITGATKLASKNLLYRETGWETLDQRRKQHRLIQFYKMYHGLTPDYLKDLITFRNDELHSYSTRSSQNLNTVLCRTNFYFKSFLPQTIRDWNELPIEIRNASITIFRKFINNSVNIPCYFFYGQRLSQIYHTRLRLKCSSLKQDLYNKNLVTDPKCSCGDIETTKHYLLECKNYDHIRSITIFKLKLNRIIDTELLLHGDSNLPDASNIEIFKTVQNFINLSKRFSN